MINVLLIVALLGAIGYVVFRVLYFVGEYGKIDLLGRLSFYIDGYMLRGFHKTRLRVRDPSTGKHLWFVKITTQPKDYGPTRFFLLLTPDGCSPDEFRRARQALDLSGIECYLTTEHDPTPQCLVVHCDMDVDKAVRAARCILVDVFGLTDATPLRYGLFGAISADPNAIIDWENSPQMKEYIRKRAAAGKPVPKHFMHLIDRREK